MKVTQWFDAWNKPFRKGVYQTFDDKTPLYQYWNGKYWGLLFNTIDGAAKFANKRSHWQNVKWRGVA